MFNYRFTFGYDIDSIMEVQDYVVKNYSADDYSINYEMGDDVMNRLEINIKEGGDEQLVSLLYNCDGGGDYENCCDEDYFELASRENS